MKRRLPMIVAISVGFIVLLDRFLAHTYLDALGLFFLDTAVILAVFALILGFINVLAVHTHKIRVRRAGWPYSIVLLLFSIIVLLIGWAGPSAGLPQVVFNSVQYPLQAAVASLLIFFAASAAVRAVRIRSWDSVIFVLVVLVVLLGQVPLFDYLTAVKDWIVSVPGLAGVRGLILGVALGTVVTGLRLLMGIDRPYSR